MVALSWMHLLHATWTEDLISFKHKFSTINTFKHIGRCHDFTPKQMYNRVPIMASNIDTVGTFEMAKTLAKQDSVAMLNLISSSHPIKRICLLERTDTQLCQWQCSALLIVDLCWPPQAYGAYTRWEYSKNILFKPQLTTQLICMRLVTLRTVSPHNTTPTFSNAELCGVRELIKGHARITNAPQVPSRAHSSLRSDHPPPVLQSIAQQHWGKILR